MIKYISTQPLGNKRSLIIVLGDYPAASLSILFSNSSVDYKYSDTGLGAAGYISSEDVFKFFVKKL
jgi:ABC-type microcin C transport system permease subunit YejB